MNQFVVRQPIKDSSQEIIGYEILFQDDTEGLYNQANDYAAADTISGFLMQNNDKVFTDKMTFMTFTPNLLFRNTPRIFKQKDLVIQISDNIIVHPLATNLIQRYKKEGYHIAVNNFEFSPRYFGFMEYIDYIKLDFKNYNNTSLGNIIRMGKSLGKKTIATGIDSEELYDFAMQLDVDYFQGTYIADTLMTKANKMEYLQGNFFQLVVAVTKDEPDMEEIEQIIARDASLTYALLKMVNSAYFALRHKTSSIQQALVILGLVQLKQWVYLLSFKQEEDNSAASAELLKISFLRANFCEQLYPYIVDMEISKSEAYLMGMFSTLDYLIDATLEETLEEIPIVDAVKDALISHAGRCGMLYDLVLSYEKADWKNISHYAQQLGIPSNVISQIYFDCVETVNNIWANLTNPYDRPLSEYEKINADESVLEEEAATQEATEATPENSEEKPESNAEYENLDVSE